MGFFLPIPPAAGGAIEKSWHRLAQGLARRGHQVTIISRRWKNWPYDENKEGIRYLRIPGFNHTSKIVFNLLYDFIWSWRVFMNLPVGDIVALNTVSLACWLGGRHNKAGRVIAMPGRMPKGQFRLYRRPARILVPSSPVRNAVNHERPSFSSLIRTTGYPIDYQSLSRVSGRTNDVITIGYIGRINREKGVELLLAASRQLVTQKLPSWKIVICGPSKISQGGSGPEYLSTLRAQSPECVEYHGAIFNEPELHDIYRRCDLFCYPSLAQSETFGVSVVEAMAAGAVPVVSDLQCFHDFIAHGENGLTFDAHADDAVEQLTENLATLITDRKRRNTLSLAAQTTAKYYDYEAYIERMLEDFMELTDSSTQP